MQGRACLMAQLLKNLPAMWETWLWSLGWEDPLEKGKATHSSILACLVHGVTVRHNWVTFTMLSSSGTWFLPFWTPSLLDNSVQSLSHVRLFATPWITTRQASLSITNSRSLLKLTSIESVMPSSHLNLCHPLLLLPPIPPSIRVFSNESTLRMRWPKYYSFSFSISPSNEHPGLISFRMDWLDLLAVQGTLKSLVDKSDPNQKISSKKCKHCTKHPGNRSDAEL